MCIKIKIKIKNKNSINIYNESLNILYYKVSFIYIFRMNIQLYVKLIK